MSNSGDTEADARQVSVGRATASWLSFSSGGLEELLCGVSFGRDTDEDDIGGNDGEGDSSGLISGAEDEVEKWRETGGVGAGGTVVTGLYTEPGGKTGNITPASTA